ncbi:glycosyltransferase [Jeotgalibacillus sp. S-D1]|uniref:glycosyltransferase n=1 Tax=Jeotgalibacillus sp. S-D1 TaxID=2552189 RepID=UPI0014047B5C|nr:glycosyltransferase [Jeotgalibacillus sp. S-D1]
MKKIVMMRSTKSYLPQIDASINYFNSKDLNYKLYDSSAIDGFTLRDFDAVWTFPGIDIHGTKEVPIIQEYVSLSTGIFPKLKNKIKRRINTVPALRIFLNQLVESEMNFTDGVESLQRDMGVDDLFFRFREQVKLYDCVYIGSMAKERKTEKLLRHFKEQKEKRTILMIGTVPDHIHKEFGKVENIIFTGDVPYQDVPKYASQAVYGINYMPDTYPFNLQTSTKLLEYLAMDLKIITTDYQWVNQFMEQQNMNFITINESLENLDTQLDQSKPQGICEEAVRAFSWSNIIKNAGIEEKLNQLL